MDGGDHRSESVPPRLRISDRHFVSRIRPNAPVKALTTYIRPDIEAIVEAELEQIRQGRATRSHGHWYTVESGRIYVDEGGGVLYPQSGPGFIGPVGRGVNRALTILSRYNGHVETAMHQIRREKGIQPEDVVSAIKIWSLRDESQVP